MSAERKNVVAERTLREALAPFAPDSATFADEVARKIAERDASGTDEEREDPERLRMSDAIARSPFLRRAAGFLPPGLILKGLTLPASAAGKKLGWKGLAAFLTVPVLSAMMLTAAFAGGLSSVRRLKNDDALDPLETRREINLWWWTNWWKALLGFALLGWLFFTQPADAIVALLLVSMLVVVLVIRHLSRVGAASREAVGRYTGGFLANLAVWGFMFNHVVARQLGASTWIIVALFATASAVCFQLARWNPAWSRARKVLPLVVPPVLGLALIAGVQPRPLDSEACSRYLESFDEPVHRTAHWTAWGLTARNLLDSPHDDLDLSGPREIVDRAMASTDAAEKVPTYALVAAARGGALTPNVSKLVEASHYGRALLDSDSHISFLQQYGAGLRVLAAQGLTPEERNILARRLLASWPKVSQFRALKDMAFIVEHLGVIGADDRAEGLRESAHEALWSLWLGRVDEGVSPTPFDYSLETVGDYKSDFFYDQSTAAAVELLIRFGPPEGLDLRRVRAWLVRAGSAQLPEWMPLFGPAEHNWISASTLLRFDAHFTLSARESVDWVNWLLRERVLLGCVLLALLCMYATARAPGPGGLVG